MMHRRNNMRYEEVGAAIALLAEAFPKASAVFEQRRRPLKVGIRLDLLARLNGALTEIELRQVLRAYTANGAYRRRLRAGVERVDLDGAVAGIVTVDEETNAREKIAAAEVKAAAREESQAPQPKRDGLAELRAAAQRRKISRNGARRDVDFS
jgi:ProP effector